MILWIIFHNQVRITYVNNKLVIKWPGNIQFCWLGRQTLGFPGELPSYLRFPRKYQICGNPEPQ